MPRLLDTGIRAVVLYDAVCALVEQGGVRAASVRGVAREVGLNTSSLRHHFGNHGKLLSHVLARAARALGPRDWLPAPDDRAHARRMARSLLEGLLPLDEQRLRTTVVVGELQAAARYEPELGPAATSAEERLTELAEVALAWFRWCRLTEVDPVELAHLLALVEGLRRRLCDPHVPLDAELARGVLQRHLDLLDPQP